MQIDMRNQTVTYQLSNLDHCMEIRLLCENKPYIWIQNCGLQINVRNELRISCQPDITFENLTTTYHDT